MPRRVRAVAQARKANDAPALRGALIDLAAAALSYADAVARIAAVRNDRDLTAITEVLRSKHQ